MFEINIRTSGANMRDAMEKIKLGESGAGSLPDYVTREEVLQMIAEAVSAVQQSPKRRSRKTPEQELAEILTPPEPIEPEVIEPSSGEIGLTENLEAEIPAPTETIPTVEDIRAYNNEIYKKGDEKMKQNLFALRDRYRIRTLEELSPSQRVEYMKDLEVAYTVGFTSNIPVQKGLPF